VWWRQRSSSLACHRPLRRRGWALVGDPMLPAIRVLWTVCNARPGLVAYHHRRPTRDAQRLTRWNLGVRLIRPDAECPICGDIFHARARPNASCGRANPLWDTGSAQGRLLSTLLARTDPRAHWGGPQSVLLPMALGSAANRKSGTPKRPFTGLQHAASAVRIVIEK
jgi:hypothetical protein